MNIFHIYRFCFYIYIPFTILVRTQLMSELQVLMTSLLIWLKFSTKSGSYAIVSASYQSSVLPLSWFNTTPSSKISQRTSSIMISIPSNKPWDHCLLQLSHLLMPCKLFWLKAFCLFYELQNDRRNPIQMLWCRRCWWVCSACPKPC